MEVSCNELIEQMYKHPKVNKLIGSIHPHHLQDELRQEFALILLEYDCEKLLQINQAGKLLSFATRIIWKMGTLPNTKFYKIFRKPIFVNMQYEEFANDIEPDLGETLFIIEKNISDKFNSNANEVHEAMIWTKYVELQSCQKVAEFFGIPRLHAFQVVKKVKKELRKKF